MRKSLLELESLACMGGWSNNFFIEKAGMETAGTVKTQIYVPFAYGEVPGSI